MRRAARTLREERGATTVEFAIVASLFFMIMFALIDVSRVFGMHERLRAAVREGARVAAVQSDPASGVTAIDAAVKAAAMPMGGSAVTDAQISLGVDTANKQVIVSVLSYSMPLITPFASTFGHATVALSASAAMPWYRAP